MSKPKNIPVRVTVELDSDVGYIPRPHIIICEPLADNVDAAVERVAKQIAEMMKAFKESAEIVGARIVIGYFLPSDEEKKTLRTLAAWDVKGK